MWGEILCGAKLSFSAILDSAKTLRPSYTILNFDKNNFYLVPSEMSFQGVTRSNSERFAIDWKNSHCYQTKSQKIDDGHVREVDFFHWTITHGHKNTYTYY